MLTRIIGAILDRPPPADPAGRAAVEALRRRSGRWPSLRRAHLLARPACAACGSLRNLNVHHVLPYHVFPHLELDPGNLLTLCEGPVVNCHFLFGHARDWSAWVPQARRVVERWALACREARQAGAVDLG